MSYTKQTWKAGDEITSAKLNHMEDGINNIATEVANFPVDIDNPQDGDTLIYNAAEQKWISGSGGGFLKVGLNMETGALDKTWKQIHDAALVGPVILLIDAGEQQILYYLREVNISRNEIDISKNEYQVGFDTTLYFLTDSENDYPVHDTSTPPDR